MPTYPELNSLINIQLTCKYASGFENFKTRYGSGQKFRVGKLKDFKKDVSDDGNFEAATPIKGTKRAEWDWQPENFNAQDWDSSFSWTFFKGSEEYKVKLTWLQNKNLTEKLPKDFPKDTGVQIIPKISDKTVDFEVVGEKTEEAPKAEEPPAPPPPEDNLLPF